MNVCMWLYINIMYHRYVFLLCFCTSMSYDQNVCNSIINLILNTLVYLHLGRWVTVRLVAVCFAAGSLLSTKLCQLQHLSAATATSSSLSGETHHHEKLHVIVAYIFIQTRWPPSQLYPLHQSAHRKLCSVQLCRFSSVGCLASLAEHLHFTQHRENHNLKEEAWNQAVSLTFAVFVHIRAICYQVTS